MNVFIVGFPLQIGAGLLMVGLSLSFWNHDQKTDYGDA